MPTSDYNSCPSIDSYFLDISIWNFRFCFPVQYIYLDLLDELLLVQEQDLDMEGLVGGQAAQPAHCSGWPATSLYILYTVVDLLYSYMPTGKLFGVVYNPHFNIYLLLLLSYPLTCFNYSRDERGGAGWLLNRITWSHDEDKYSRWAVERYRIRGYSLPLLSLTHLLTFSPSSANTVIFRKPEQSTHRRHVGGACWLPDGRAGTARLLDDHSCQISKLVSWPIWENNLAKYRKIPHSHISSY